MSELESKTRYDPSEVEPRIMRRWLDSGLFHPTPEGTAAENYSIVIPPPNVTGSLHMGHALNNSIQDVLIRHHRLRGRRTKWILGTDHAGIATQTQVERALAAEGSSREQLGREAFISRVWDWRERYGSTIIDQLKRLGASCDYQDERFTLDPGYVEAVVTVFVELYRKGLIYRDRYIVNWDPGSRSAISDLEVEEREVTSTLYSIDYDLEGGGRVTVATVRPETMLADTGVAVHPGDDRYRALVGGVAILPLVGRRLPIVADEHVRPEFGTGALKVTPGHDPLDFEIGHRHGLEQVNVIGEDGRVTPAAGERFAGLTTAEAREAVVAALRSEGRIAAEAPYVHEVPYSHRSGERIEPLVSLQWFMAMNQLAQPAIEAVASGAVRIHPENHRRVYLDWMDNIRPWCISRQLWWGHRLPVYYCEGCGHTHVSADPPRRCEACGGPVRQDDDVLDTWFSSALWPFATLGWPHDTPGLRAFYPTDVLLTARDILFLWVARMIMMGIEFTRDVPFHDVYVHSIIQAPDGRRMSKSLGTGIDPLEEIERHGADAVRFGLLAMSSSQDVRYSPEKIEQGQRLANKLWNASRLVLLNVRPDVAPEPRPETLEDRWILSRLQRAKRSVASHVERFDFSHAALGLYDFIYGELCDWYLELVKPRLYDDEADSGAVSATLLHVLGETLAMAHPVIPFVTEEIWSYLPGADGLLAGHRAADPDDGLVDDRAEEQVGRAIEAVREVRGWRDRVGVTARDRVPARLEAAGYEVMADQVARLARLDLSPDGGDPVARVTIPGGAVLVLAGGGFDPEAAERRRAQRRDDLQAEIARSEAKLANQGFVAKAPAAVVEGEREKLRRLQGELEAL
ncbi:MAG TPA: valine--tRNA ligase [Solirubrobacteraceae bacterium]|nr:valine--tRNA ligase [Solirubrobacteraceae bacterium]